MPNRLDDSLRAANNIGILNRSKTLKGSVGTGDRVDFYKFALSRRSSFSLALDQLRVNADVRLLKRNGVAIATSTRPGIKTERIAETLEAGTYYISVNRRGGNTQYSLQVATKIDPGSSMNEALDVGVLSGTVNYQDFVGESDDALDYYKFSLNQVSDFNATISGLTSSSYVNLELIFDANRNGFLDGNESIASASSSIYSNSPISETLPPGTYFIAVKSSSSFSDQKSYNLALSTSSPFGNIPSDPGDSLTSAYGLGTVSGSLAARELVGSLDKTDVYQFNLGQISDVSLALNQVSDFVKLDLIWDANANGFIDGDETIGSGYASIDSNTSVSLKLPAGSYFAKVSSSNIFNNNTKYELGISAIAQPSNIPLDPGSDLVTAYNLGELSSTLTAQDLVGFIDKTDYYRFNLAQSGNFSAALSGLFDSVSMSLILDANRNQIIDGGERIASGSGSTSFNNPISKSLQAGEYFVEVKYSSVYKNTPYTLSLSRS